MSSIEQSLWPGQGAGLPLARSGHLSTGSRGRVCGLKLWDTDKEGWVPSGQPHCCCWGWQQGLLPSLSPRSLPVLQAPASHFSCSSLSCCTFPRAPSVALLHPLGKPAFETPYDLVCPPPSLLSCGPGTSFQRSYIPTSGNVGSAHVGNGPCRGTRGS